MKSVLKIILVVNLLFILGCDDYLEIEPQTLINEQNAIVNQSQAEESAIGLYNALQAQGYYGIHTLVLGDLMTDVITTARPVFVYVEYDENQILSTNNFLALVWANIYNSILRANYILEKVPEIDVISEDLYNKVLGEAYFIRAFGHYNLASFFGDIPIALTTYLPELRALQREPVDRVLEQAVSDLESAIELLPESHAKLGNFSSDQVTRARATKISAKALLARVLLTSSSTDFNRIIDLCNEIITNPNYTLENNYASVFQDFSKESIWELSFTQQDKSSIPMQLDPRNSGAYKTEQKLVNAIKANGNDARESMLAIPYSEGYFCNKYNDPTSNVKLIRLAEIYLIRAEAYALRGNGSDNEMALKDLNIVRARSGVGEISESSNLIRTILQERYIEFAFEGFRYNDLRRTGMLDEVMSELNPDTWESTDRFFPIPQNETNLGLTQNDGYY